MASGGQDEISLDLSPENVLKAIMEMKGGFADLTQTIEEQFGRRAPRAIDDLENSAKEGTSKITSYFRNLGQRVREDLRTAFDATGVMAGAKFARDMGEGVRQVFEMERAFDRLNSRLKLTTSEMSTFKTEVGRRVANTGASLQDVLPGVETASARGGIRNPAQLAAIAESLGRVNQTTGEDTAGLSETVVEILKNQGQKVTADTFKATVDALQGTRTAGAFTSAEEAGRNVEALSPYARQFKLSTRELGGLSATASQAGSQGNNILQQLLQQASAPGGQQKLNSIFGQQIFKGGKLDASAIGNIDTNRFGQFSQQTLGEATGLSGASGADLKRFIESFRDNKGSFDKVVSGANETAEQFDVATDNLASKFDQFKQNVMRSTREVGDALSTAGSQLLKGNVGGALGTAGGAAGKVWENKGTLATAGLLTAGVGMLAGGSLNRLLGRVGGGVAKGAAAKAAGVEPVYVVNAAEIGEAGAVKFDSLSSRVGGALEKMGGVGGIAMTAGKYGLAGAGIAGAGAVGYGIGSVVNSVTGNDGSLGEKLYDWTHPDEPKMEQAKLPEGPTADQIGRAVADAFRAAGLSSAGRPEYINKSAVTGTGKGI